MPIPRMRSTVPSVRGPITLVGSMLAQQSNNGGNISLTLPTGIKPRDVCYIFFGTSTTAAAVTIPEGWTQVGSTTDNTVRSAIFRKVIGPAPETTTTIIGNGSAFDGTNALVIALRGVNTAVPEDTTPVTTTGSSTNPDPASITTLTDGAWVIIFGCSAVSEAGVTEPAGYATDLLINSAESNPVSTAITHKTVTAAGAEDPAAFTSWGSGAWVAWTLAVRPATV